MNKMKKKNMFSMPQELATTIQNYASIVTILAAFVSACAGVLTFIASSNLSRYSDESIALANSVSAQANNSAAKANEKAEAINKQNLELQIKLEKERKERLELQKAVERRSLSPESIKSIQEASERIKDKLSIRLECNQNDYEAVAYTEQIGSLLHNLGHKADGVGTGVVIHMDSSNVGVFLFIYDTANRSSVMSLLWETGIATQAKILTTKHEDGHDAMLSIMQKPPYIG